MCQYCWINAFWIRTWQIWECIWNWYSPRPVPKGGHHKSAISSLASPCVPAGLPTVPLRQDVLGPRYFSDQILPCSLTPLTRFCLLNCPAVWLSTLGLTAHLWFPSGCNVRIVDSAPFKRGPFLGSLHQEMAMYSSITAWRIPWRGELGEIQPIGSQSVGHDWATHTQTHTHTQHVLEKVKI